MKDEEQHTYQIGCEYAASPTWPGRVMIVNVWAPTKRAAIAAAKRAVQAQTGHEVDHFVELSGAAYPHMVTAARDWEG